MRGAAAALLGAGLWLLPTASDAQANSILDSRMAPLKKIFSPIGPNRVVELKFSPCSDHVFTQHYNGFIAVWNRLNPAEDGKSKILFDFQGETFGWEDNAFTALEFDPDFPGTPYVYILYSAENVPPWQDTCPRIGSLQRHFCQTKVHLDRMKLDVSVAPNGTCLSFSFTDSPANRFRLLDDACSCSSTHHNGDLKFHPTTKELYMTIGEGSQFDGADYGIPGDDTCFQPEMKFPQGKLRSQREDFHYHGKLLAIKRDAQLADAQLTPASYRMIAKGLRNPYALGFDPRTGDLYVGDVGSNVRDEINRVDSAILLDAGHPILNFGWPCVEGNLVTQVEERDWLTLTCDPATAAGCNYCTNIWPCIEPGASPGVGNCAANYKPPLLSYRPDPVDPHYDACKANSAAITGFAFLNGNAPKYGTNGTWAPYNLVVGDLGKACVWTFNNQADGRPDFTSPIGLYQNWGTTSLITGADNYIYSTSTEGVYRIAIKTTTDPPTAALVLSVQTAANTFAPCGDPCQITAGSVVKFDASATVASGTATIVSYTFDAGEGGPTVTQASPILTHTYNNDGSYSVTVTALDSSGLGDIGPKPSVLVGLGVSVVMTPGSYQWGVGDVVSYTLSAGGFNPPLQSNQIAWARKGYHCLFDKCTNSNQCHYHSLGVDAGSATGFSGTFTAFTHPMPTYTELQVQITPSSGPAITQVFRTDPLNYTATLNSNPQGWPIIYSELDPCFTPCTVPFMKGYGASLYAERVQAGSDGNIYVLTGWQITRNGNTAVDNSCSSLAVTIDSDNMVITAQYSVETTAASALPAPILQRASGFYLSLDTSWVKPTGLTGMTHYAVFVTSTTAGAPAGAARASRTVPFSETGATINVPAGTYSYDIKVAAIDANASPKQITVLSNVKSATSTNNPAQICYNKPGPFMGITRTVPGSIDAEDFDNDGSEIAYHDTDIGNRGGAYRLNFDVDIDALTTGSYAVTYTAGGEWLQYSDVLFKAGTYNINYYAAGPGGAILYLMLDANTCDLATAVSKVTTAGTASWYTMQPNQDAGVTLPGGYHTIRLCMTDGTSNIDKFEFVSTGTVVPSPTPTTAGTTIAPTVAGATTAPTLAGTTIAPTLAGATTAPTLAGTTIAPTLAGATTAPTLAGTTMAPTLAGATQAPTLATLAPTIAAVPTPPPTTTGVAFAPHAIPGTIRFVDFDNGIEGVAYHDMTPGNTGGDNTYRPQTDVDLDLRASTGKYVVGWTSAGEWLRFSEVQITAGTYDITFNLACGVTGPQTFLIVVDAVSCDPANAVATVSATYTGGWYSYAKFTALAVTLPGGSHTIRACLDGGVNLDSMLFTTSTGTVPGAPVHFLLNHAIPGSIFAVNFDYGDAGLAYSDSSDGDAGGLAYRPPTDVDIYTGDLTAFPGSGYVVGGTAPNEWLLFSGVQVAGGYYDVTFRISAVYASIGVYIMKGDVNCDRTTALAGVAATNTGGWDNYQDFKQTGVYIPAGKSAFKVCVGAGGMNLARFTFAASTGPAPAPVPTTQPTLAGATSPPTLAATGAPTTPATGPYNGPKTIPGTIEAEDFDYGLEGDAYHDTSPANKGGSYRTTGVDIEARADGKGYVVSYADDGEWLKFSQVTVTAGNYDIVYRASCVANSYIYVMLNNAACDRTTALSYVLATPSGGWDAYTVYKQLGVALPGGQTTLRVCYNSNVNFDKITFTTAAVVTGPTPYAPHTIPGTIELEDYDNGDNGEAYLDSTPGNSGGAYRTDDVDVEKLPNPPVNYNVAYITNGEWLQYSGVAVTAGSYTVTYNVACIANIPVYLMLGAVPCNANKAISAVTCPNTGGWGNYLPVVDPNPVVLAQSNAQTFRVCFGGAWINADSIKFVLN